MGVYNPRSRGGHQTQPVFLFCSFSFLPLWFSFSFYDFLPLPPPSSSNTKLLVWVGGFGAIMAIIMPLFSILTWSPGSLLIVILQLYVHSKSVSHLAATKSPHVETAPRNKFHWEELHPCILLLLLGPSVSKWAAWTSFFLSLLLDNKGWKVWLLQLTYITEIIVKWFSLFFQT